MAQEKQQQRTIKCPELEGKKVLDIVASDRERDSFALFCGNKTLYITEGEEVIAAFKLKNIKTDDDTILKTYFNYPYVVVSERYGLNASVVNITTGGIAKIKRADYQSQFCSFPIAFVKYKDAPALVYGSTWNRLDLLDLETFKRITKREKHGYKGAAESMADLDGNKDLNYFHSLLHPTPDGEAFLSNGWVWHPVGNVLAFNVNQFSKKFEQAKMSLDYVSPYNWDMPLAFIDEDLFVMATDRVRGGEPGENAGEYNQLQFFRLSEAKDKVAEYSGSEKGRVSYKYKSIQSFAGRPCDCFQRDEYGDIHGELHYDPELKRLVSLSENGAFVITLEGKAEKGYPMLCCNHYTNSNFITYWQYSTKFHYLYRIDRDLSINILQFDVEEEETYY